MLRVRDFMTPSPHSIDCQQSLAEAQDLMDQRGVHHLLVTDRGKLVGILSDHDVDHLERQKRVDPEVLTAGEAMTPEPYVIEPGAALAEVAAEMARAHVDSALVVKDGLPVGIFTATDALVALSRLARTA